MTKRQPQFTAREKTSWWESLVKAQTVLAFDTTIEAGNQRAQIHVAFADLDRGVLSPRLEATVSMAEEIAKGANW